MDTEDLEYTLTLRGLRQIMAEAWDEGARKASPYEGAYLRLIYASNPYRISNTKE